MAGCHRGLGLESDKERRGASRKNDVTIGVLVATKSIAGETERRVVRIIIVRIARVSHGEAVPSKRMNPSPSPVLAKSGSAYIEDRMILLYYVTKPPL